MNSTKKLIVVLTLALLAFIILTYMIVTKSTIGTSNNSPIIFLQAEKNNNSIEEVSSTKLANDEENERAKIAVTSRSGKHEPVTTVPEEIVPANEPTETTEAVAQEQEPVTESISVDTIEEPSNTIEPAPTEQIEPEIIEEEKPSFEGVELEYSAPYNITSAHLTKSKGVVYYDGHKETYYSQKVLAGKGLTKLNNNGRHVADDGTIRDGDGYIAVACNYLPKGSEIMTSLGPGKVYDTGGMTGKWIDIYVNW